MVGEVSNIEDEELSIEMNLVKPLGVLNKYLCATLEEMSLQSSVVLPVNCIVTIP